MATNGETWQVAPEINYLIIKNLCLLFLRGIFLAPTFTIQLLPDALLSIFA